MAKAPPLELFLFTDEPIRDLTGDHLGLRPFSAMVAAAALSNRGPLNIGVFSSWGQGKTSVLHQAKALIEEQRKPNVITAWVNAWQYEHEAHPIVPLLAIIINEITKSIDARKSVGRKDDDAISKTFGDLKRALRSIAYGFSAKVGSNIPGFANLEIGFVAKDMIDRDEKLSSDRDPLLDQSLYYHAYERLEKFRTELNKSAPADQPKIVVFIDDLDRCLPAKALHLLESLKLVLAQPGFIFVLGVDRHVIDSFLTKRYHRDFGISADKGHGRQYMDKIIQLPLDLPHHQSRFEKYIGNLILDDKLDKLLPPAFRALFAEKEAGPAFIAALAAGCERTPRTLIRTLNYLLTDLFLRQQDFYDQTNDPFGKNHAEFLQFSAVSRITRITLGSDKERLYRSLLKNDQFCFLIAQSLSGESDFWDADLNDPDWGYSYSGGIEDYKKNIESMSDYRMAIYDSDSLKELFVTPLGQRWLREHVKRQAIEDFLAERQEAASVPDETSEQIVDAAVRKKLNFPEGSVDDENRKKITALDLGFTRLRDLTALKSLTSIQMLDLRGTQVTDLAPLQNLINLESLNISNPHLSNLNPISSLVNLRTLILRGTQVDDLAPLESMIGLQTLDLGYSPVTDISSLGALTSLQTLDLRNTNVHDFRPLHCLKGSLIGIRVNQTPGAKNEEMMMALRNALPTTTIVG